MAFFYYLPAELQFYLRELPDKILRSLEIDSEKIKRLNFKDQISVFHNELEQLVIKKGDKEIRQYIMTLRRMSLLMLEDYVRLRENCQDIDYFWDNYFLLASYRYDVNKSIVSNPVVGENLKKPQSEIQKQAYKLTKNLIVASGNPKELVNSLISFVKEHPSKFLQDIPRMVIMLSVFSSIIYKVKGTAEQIYPQFIAYCKRTKMDFLLMHLYTDFANGKLWGFELQKAINYYEDAIEISKQLQMDRMNSIRNNLGIALYNAGQWDKAIELYKELHANNPQTSTYINNLADVYFRKQEYIKAYQLIKEKYHIKEMDELHPLNFIHQLYIEMEKEDDENEMMELARSIIKKNPTTTNQMYLILFKARHLHFKKNLGSAMDEVEEVINMALENNNFPVLVNGQLLRIKIQIDMVEIKKSTKQINNLYDMVNNFLQFTEDQQMPSASIRGLRLRAKINQNRDLIDDARKDLNDAMEIAEKYNFNDLHSLLTEELNQLDHYTKTETKSEKGFITTLKENVKSLFSISLSGNYTQQNYTIHGCIIMSKNGIPLYSKYMSDKLKSDSSLISGLLSAISSFFEEVTEGTGFLKTIDHDEMTILFEPYADFLIVNLVSDDVFEVREQFKEYVEKTSNLLKTRNITNHPGEVPKSLKEQFESITIGTYQ